MTTSHHNQKPALRQRKRRTAMQIVRRIVGIGLFLALLVVALFCVRASLTPSGWMHPFGLAPVEAAHRQDAFDKFNRYGEVVEPLNPLAPHAFSVVLLPGKYTPHEISDTAAQLHWILGEGFKVRIYDHSHRLLPEKDTK